MNLYSKCCNKHIPFSETALMNRTRAPHLMSEQDQELVVMVDEDIEMMEADIQEPVIQVQVSI